MSDMGDLAKSAMDRQNPDRPSILIGLLVGILSAGVILVPTLAWVYIEYRALRHEIDDRTDKAIALERDLTKKGEALSIREDALSSRDKIVTRREEQFEQSSKRAAIEDRDATTRKQLNDYIDKYHVERAKFGFQVSGCAEEKAYAASIALLRSIDALSKGLSDAGAGYHEFVENERRTLVIHTVGNYECGHIDKSGSVLTN
jgi:hypothetical protein